MNPTSFEAWLLGQVRDVLGRDAAPAPWLLWCDPRQEWRELLQQAAQDGPFELWECDASAGGWAHGELGLRHRFAAEDPAPRVVWLPVTRQQIGWFKVFELRATSVWERGLLDALREYGVDVRRSDEAALAPVLAPFAREWFAEPKERWSELTPGNASGALVDDERVFEVLAGAEGAFSGLVEAGRFEIFARRVVLDFGLPQPEATAESSWRIAALARLLATEAAEASPGDPPSEGERVIPPGACRDRALGLLRRWQTHIAWVASLEALVPLADAQLGLTWWARNAATPPRSRLSRAVEQALFDQAALRLDRIEDVDLLVTELERAAPAILDRTDGFWSRVAREKVPWGVLGDLARAAGEIARHQGCESAWRSAADAVAWYTGGGWRLDAERDGLFVEDDRLPSTLHGIRVRLRRACIRVLDRIGARFSELLAASPGEILDQPSAGELALAEVEARTGPMALVFLDACRYDLGCRLAEALNAGEPRRRAQVKAAVAPIPSITALGMAFALPMPRSALTVTMAPDAGRFCIQAFGFPDDLTSKQHRERWLDSRIKAAAHLTVNDVLEDRAPAATSRSRRIVVVHGAELDTTGHEGRLEMTGADAEIERYARAIRRLRDRGYNRVVVVTDHGFFLWQPAGDEVERDKPTGSVRWSSRRAIVGTGLSHPTALLLPVSRSDLRAAVPRSVNAWQTYGGLGYFHGGATLQEIVIPVLVVSWPPRTSKVGVVLKPVGNLTSCNPRVEVQVASEALIATEGLVGRRVLVRVQDGQGRVVFRHEEPVLVEIPRTADDHKPRPVQLDLVARPPEGLAFGAPLVAILRDADDDEELAREPAILRVELDDWE